MIARQNRSLLEVGEKSTVFYRCQLLDETKTPISAIDSAFATVHAEDASKTVTKTRITVDGANGGLFTATVAVSTITVGAAEDVKIVTSSAHLLRTGDTVYLSGISGTDAAELNTRLFAVEVLDPTTFLLADLPGRYLSTLTGGTVATGVFELTLLTADTAIVGTITEGHTEKHTLLIEVAYDTTKVINDTRVFEVYSIEKVT